MLAALALAGGCAKRGSDKVEREYPLKGTVQSVDLAKHTVRITHDDVPGLMPGMTMDFPVLAGDAANLRAGERITATLVIDRPGAEPRLVQIWPDERSARAAIAAGQKALREDTHDRGDEAYREVGERMPDFTLYDQNGAVVPSGRFRGKQVMLNFIYTSCPFPDMCPAATAKMAMAQKLARTAGVKDVEFVSITLDPVHDTPGVLNEYARSRGIDTANFSFLTGPAGAVQDLLTQFGVIADFSGGVPKHTLATLLIDARGRIVWRADGSGWDPAEAVKHMHKA